MTVRAALISLAVGISSGGVLGCAGRAIPDPKPVAERYASAVQSDDSQGVYALLDRASQRNLGPRRVSELLAGSKQEVTTAARAIAAPNAEITTTATVRFVDGETATLTSKGGRFRVTAAAALPALARTPEQALGELRSVLARRSYAGLVRVLTQDAASGLEDKLKALVDALQQPDTLEIQTDDNRALVEIPGGHRVELEREGGFWKIRDFE